MLALAGSCFAQLTVTGTINAAASSCTSPVMNNVLNGPGACVSMQLPPNAGAASIVLAGTFSATVQFELSADNGNTWTAAATASSTSAGTTNFSAAAYTHVRARASAYTSGSATTTITASTASTAATLSGSSPVTISAGGAIGCATCVTSAAALTSGSPMLGGGGQASATAAFLTTDGTTQFNIGPADAANNGILGLKGKTSGTATFTAPAVAGTTTNPVAMSNVLLGPDGAVSTPTFGFASETNNGWYRRTAQEMSYGQQGHTLMALQGFATYYTMMMASDVAIGWSSGGAGSVSSGMDINFSRAAAGVLQLGGTAEGTTGVLKLAAIMSVGTTFTSNGGCSEGTLVGGATAGKFTTSGSTGCTVIITMGNSATAPNGWSCTAIDLTTVGAVSYTHLTLPTTPYV